MALLGGLGEVDSAAPSDALWLLGRLVRGSPELTVHFENGLAGLEGRLRDDPAAAAFLDAFDDFLDRYGARGPNEWEMGCEVWGTNPALPLALIDRMRGAADDHAPDTRGARWAADREQAVAVARRRVRPHERWWFDRGLRCTVLRTRGRERCKTILVEAIHEGRLRLRELGRRLADRHQGVAPDDLLYVTLDEFAPYRSAPDAFAVTVAERRAALGDAGRGGRCGGDRRRDADDGGRVLQQVGWPAQNPHADPEPRVPRLPHVHDSPRELHVSPTVVSPSFEDGPNSHPDQHLLEVVKVLSGPVG